MNMNNDFTAALALLNDQTPDKLTEYTLFHPSLLTEAAFQQLDQRIQQQPAEANLKTLKAFLHELKTTILQGFQPHAANEFADVIYAAKQAQDEYQQNTDYEALQNAVAYWSQLLICVDEYPVSDDTRLTILNDSLQALMDYYWATGEISALEYAHRNIERLQQAQFAETPDQAVLVNNLAMIFAEYYRFYNDPAYLEKSLDFYRQTLALTPEGTDDYALSLSNYGMALQEYFECTGDVQVLKDSVEYSEQAVALTDAALPQYAARYFSCHGRSDLQNPLRSALWMANGEALNLQDFLNTRLHAQLAVLSACETGLPGTRLPDEAVSLAAGLLQAGVVSVVSSLWSVAEISTFLLMLRFYRNLAEASPAEALRRAQQWLRDSTNREILAEVRKQVEAGRLDEAAYKQVRLAIGFKAMDERSFAPLFDWAAFGVVGV